VVDRRALEEMSWRDVDEAIAAGYRTVVVPSGSMEQHGPHMTMQTDTLLATELAKRIVERVDDTLRGPTISIGISDHHLAFAGTVSLQSTTFAAILRDYAASLDRHGFETAYFFSGHGGNFAALGDLERETGGRVGNLRVLCYDKLVGFLETFNAVAIPDGITPEEAGAHAGEAETSCVLSVRPDLVRMDRAEAGYVGAFDDAAIATVLRDGMTALTANGILGDARPATAPRGVRYLDALADLLANDLKARLE
jgi:creatinine amidohydrolase